MPYTETDFADLIKQKYPAYAQMPDDELVARIVAKYPQYQSQVAMDPRTAIKMRAIAPPESSRGDPNADQNAISAGDVAAAAGKGLAHLVGVPTSVEEVPGAAKTLLMNALTMGGYGTAQAVAQGAQDVSQGRVSMLQKPVEDVLGPTRAALEGRPATKGENLGAIESGTSLAGVAALQHPAVGAAMADAAGASGEAMARSGTQSYADALATRGSDVRPLAETIGSQLAGKGQILTNPKAQLPDAVAELQGQRGAIQMPKAGDPAREAQQLETLKKNFPNATVEDAGDQFIVRREQNAGDVLAADAPKETAPLHPVRALAKGALGTGLGGGVGFVVGGPAGAVAGAKIGAGLMEAQEAAQTVKSLINSPLWKTTSGVVKTSLGKAMAQQDFGEVASIGTRILAGQNLEDSYGHDEALFDMVKDALTSGHNLSDYDAVYVNPDGSVVNVPYHVAKATRDAITGK